MEKIKISHFPAAIIEGSRHQNDWRLKAATYFIKKDERKREIKRQNREKGTGPANTRDNDLCRILYLFHCTRFFNDYPHKFGPFELLFLGIFVEKHTVII